MTFLTAISLVSAFAAGLSSDQLKDVDKRIQSYLMEHPESLKLALENLSKVEEEKAKQQSADAIKENEKQLFQDKNAPVLGQGEKSLVVFLDPRCGYCKKIHKELDDLKTKARIIIKDVAVLGPESQMQVLALMAAHKQNLYFEFLKALETKSRLEKEDLVSMAVTLGAKKEQFEKDMNAPETKELLKQNMQLAGTIGLSGTPGFVIKGQLVEGFHPADKILKLLQ